MSHEVRTPLAAVFGLASEMRDRLGDFTPDEIADLARVVADQSEELAGIVDLVVNAQRHGGPGVRIVLSEDGASARVEVRDDGPELPFGAADRIFDAFFYSQPGVGAPQASVGLGLTVSRRLAREMGGDLTYRRDGVETVFALSLPKQADPAASPGHRTLTA